MATNFIKENYKKGMTVYLLYTGYNLYTGKYAPRRKNSITEGVITEKGKEHLIVSSGEEKAFFVFDEETEQIWQDVKESKSVHDLELYKTKEAAEEAVLRYKLIHETSNIFVGTSRYNKLDKHSIRDLRIINNFAKMIDSEKENLDHTTLNWFLGTLPSDIKDSFYRKIWAEHVYEDICNMYTKISKKRAEKVSGAYVNGRYDCNLSYWENLNNLLEEIPEEQTKQECFSLHECLTKRLQTEVSAIRRCSAIDIDFINNNGIEDETQIYVYHNILTKGGTTEAEDMFRSLEKELEANHNRIISCTVVASAETEEELDKLLD